MRAAPKASAIFYTSDIAGRTSASAVAAPHIAYILHTYIAYMPRTRSRSSSLCVSASTAFHGCLYRYSPNTQTYAHPDRLTPTASGTAGRACSWNIHTARKLYGIDNDLINNIQTGRKLYTSQWNWLMTFLIPLRVRRSPCRIRNFRGKYDY